MCTCKQMKTVINNSGTSYPDAGVYVYAGPFPPIEQVPIIWPSDSSKEIFASYCHEREPFICPVCMGRGVVKDGFYEWKEESDTRFVNCRTCQGKGIIWSE